MITLSYLSQMIETPNLDIIYLFIFSICEGRYGCLLTLQFAWTLLICNTSEDRRGYSSICCWNYREDEKERGAGSEREREKHTRIRYACKSLTNEVAEAVFRRTGASRRYTQLGKKITELRNDIAHGNEPRHELRSIANEYQLLINLVFAMRLIRLQIPDEDVARLMRCKS